VGDQVGIAISGSDPVDGSADIVEVGDIDVLKYSDVEL
jgi:hypothetical protein